MSLKQRITDDMKAAMRAKEAERLNTIRMLLAAMKQKEVDERIELDDTLIVAIVDKLIKQRKDAAQQYEGGGRQDLADKEKSEIVVLEAYSAAAPEHGRGEGGGPGHRGRVGRLGPWRHGQGHGRGQAAPGGSSRHGRGVCRREGRARWLIRAANKGTMPQAFPFESLTMSDSVPLQAIAEDVYTAPQLTPEAMALGG